MSTLRYKDKPDDTLGMCVAPPEEVHSLVSVQEHPKRWDRQDGSDPHWERSTQQRSMDRLCLLACDQSMLVSCLSLAMQTNKIDRSFRKYCHNDHPSQTSTSTAAQKPALCHRSILATLLS